MRMYLLCAVATAALAFDDVEDLPLESRSADALGSTTLTKFEQLWPGGVINYYVYKTTARGNVDPLVWNDTRIQGAIAHWEEKTCIRFRRCKKHSTCKKRAPYLRFIAHETKCSSYVGVRAGGKMNRVYLKPGCMVGSVVHEIGHALGLKHEQSRRDRDRYVSIVEEEILETKEKNFRKNQKTARDLGQYDYGSIMHYRPLSFSKTEFNPTIIAPQLIGQREGLSDGDIKSIHFLYNNCKKYTAPLCIASADMEVSHVIPYSQDWTVDFNAQHPKDMTVSYFGTTADVDFSVKSGDTIKPMGYTTLTFRPKPCDVGRLFQLRAVFTAKDGTRTACAVIVEVANTHVINPITAAPTEAPTDVPETPQPETEAPTNTTEPAEPETEAPTNTTEPAEPETEAPTNTTEPAEPETEAPTNATEPAEPETDVPETSEPATAAPTDVPATPPPTEQPKQHCEDLEVDGNRWRNPYNAPCGWYEYYNACDKYGHLSDSTYTANEACCVCGGGRKLTPKKR